MPSTWIEMNLPDGREDVPIEIDYEIEPGAPRTRHYPGHPPSIKRLELSYKETGEPVEEGVFDALDEKAAEYAFEHATNPLPY